MPNVQYEYTREPPQGAAERRYADGEPILYAYECVLLERDTGSRYIYTAVNVRSGVKEVLSRRANPLTTSGVEAMVEKISLSKAAGAGRLQADRPEKNHIGKENARLILNVVFRDILPQSGYAIREEQIALALHNLETIERRGVTLAEAEVGTGKTHAYLVPAIIAKRGRINDERNLNLYPGMPHADMSRMPIVIATSSIALQRAILTEYIPQLSRILLDGGVIKEPLTAVLRKGREHYLCERNLRSHLLFESNPDTRRVLEDLLMPASAIDLAEADVTPHVKRKISVSGRCSDVCPHRETCQYLAFREEAQSAKIDIQVCNHNYLLADTLMRAKGQTPLIPNYQILVIDEAQKFLSAARTMYGSELSSADAPGVLGNVGRMAFKREGFRNLALRAANKLCGESARLFKGLNAAAAVIADETGEEAENRSVGIDTGAARHIRNIRDISSRLLFILRVEAFYCKAAELLAWVRKRYGVSTENISLKKLLAEIGDENATREEQRELMHTQMVRLHQAICALQEIRRKAELEREQRMARKHSYNADRHLLISEKNNLNETIWKKARKLLPVERASGNASDWAIRLIWEVSRIQEQTAALARHNELICWLEQADDETKLCAIPKDLNDRLFRHQWGKGISTILTSGTLSAAGDFERTKQSLGLEPFGNMLTETTHPSPFDHRKNALLYIPEDMPFPNSKDQGYISAITDEIERLIIASHGHAAVLFTSYDAMGRVYAELSKRDLPFPMFRLDKGGVKEIERFKASDNGVLFASGALWEGIDIPGDSLSLLIIVKLPFPMPDAIGEYEQTQYPNFRAYLNSVLVPEMLIKLKQGFGRLIRTETDSGVVVILDSRVSSRGNYRGRALAALPECRVTASVNEVADFFKAKKQPDYFI
jgi:Rad3-related DNA helicase